MSLLPARMKRNQTKIERARVVTTLFIDFSHTQEQLTPKSVMESCRNSNPFKLLWLTLLPARMKKIHLENEGTRVVTTFLPLQVYGDFSKRSRAAYHKSFVEYCPISNPSKILWLSSLPARIKKNQSKMKELRVVTRFYPL